MATYGWMPKGSCAMQHADKGITGRGARAQIREEKGVLEHRCGRSWEGQIMMDRGSLYAGLSSIRSL